MYPSTSDEERLDTGQIDTHSSRHPITRAINCQRLIFLVIVQKKAMETIHMMQTVLKIQEELLRQVYL